MKQNLKIDLSILEDDFFNGVHLIGISSALQCFELCLQLNKKMGYKLKLNPSIQLEYLKNNRKYYFKVYQTNDLKNQVKHYLYVNVDDGQYLMPEIKNVDYIFMVKSNFTNNEYFNKILQNIKSFSFIQLAFEINIKQLKNPSNLLF